jgi:MFS transporter, PPP family, 3-phenylpropionic acid transporter
MTQFFNGRHQAKGQAIYNSVAYGIGGTVGGLAGGFALQYVRRAVNFFDGCCVSFTGFCSHRSWIKIGTTVCIERDVQWINGA